MIFLPFRSDGIGDFRVRFNDFSNFMGKTTFILNLWPGLGGLIRHGRWIFLSIALGFGFVASITLAGCGFWTELISDESKRWLCAGCLLCWLTLSLLGWELTRYFDRWLLYDEEGDRFLLALDSYLSGRWTEAEKIARAILKRNKRDPEILLFLATLHRHQGETAEALEILDQLDRMENTGKWSFEIEREREALTDLLSDPEDPQAEESRDELEKTEEPTGSEEETPATIRFPIPDENVPSHHVACR